MTRRPLPSRRRGTMVPILGVMSIAIFSMVAFAIDLGILTIVRTECQSTADMAALVGCRILSNKSAVTNNAAAEAMTAAKEVCLDNKVMGTNFTHSQISNIRVGVYDYNTTTQRFDAPTQWGTSFQPVAPTPANPSPNGPNPGAAPTNKAWTAIEVTTAVQQPTFFARLFGVSTMSSGAKALAVHRPRDVAFVLDYSGSMGNASSPVVPYQDTVTNDIAGMNGPDTNWPKFGHYGRYTAYNVAYNPSSYNTANSNASLRPCPFQSHNTYKTTSYSYAPSNTSGLSVGGPSMLEGDYSADGSTMTVSGFGEAVGNPATITSSTVFNPAFSWGPPRLTKGNTVTLAQPTYNFASYNVNGRIATPAPPEFATQSASGGVAYAGDRWPRKDGGRGPSGAWATHASGNTFTENWAYTLKEFLGARTFPANTYTTGAVWNTSNVTNTNPPAMLTSASSPSANNTDGVTGLDGRRLLLGIGQTGRNFRIPGQSDHTTQAAETVYGGVRTSGSWEVRDGGDTNYNSRDWIWERFGYDLDVADYRANNGAPTSGTVKQVNLLPAADRYKGYSMGPGYWGKTFFIWPPDPRWGTPAAAAATPPTSGAAPTVTQTSMSPASISSTNPVRDTNGNWIADWRCRFFLRGDSTTSTPRYFNPQTDDINTILFNGSAGHIFVAPTSTIASGRTASNSPGYYEINYRAILAWIKNGPAVFPGNLRAGRVVYYKSIPDDCDVSGTATTDLNMDKRFWREYIHFVLGIGTWDSTNYPLTTPVIPGRVLAGIESNFGYNMTGAIGVPATFTYNSGSVSPGTNPKPYMAYTDYVNRPRLHLWFGPLSMLHFLEYGGQNVRPWYAGTVREAQCWQLKAAMKSVLDDMRVNHPNDYCGLAFFANRSEFKGPRAPMSQDWFSLRNTLYFRDDMVAILKKFPDDTWEVRPYNSSFGNTGQNEIPNSQGGTDPNNGLAVAYNLLSSSTSLTKYTTVTSPSGNSTTTAPVYGERGRRGAAKIVVFETDGVPNSSQTWNYTGTGANTYFVTSGGTTPSETGITSVNGNAVDALAIAKIIVANTTATPAGFSSPNTKARIYSIGFGDIFEGWPAYSSMMQSGKDAHDFLLDMQQIGFTSGTADTMLPERNIITGPYEQPDPSQPVSGTNPLGRIERLRDCLQRIMQSGVQVTLIQ